ncbi:MAG: M20/M25/M40 family metallo-hydrolase, partial [Synergistaceae bacterium]|nr:M20/M25/M40 family metallo-hydrolase [Synergistaceae bacterium]
VYTPTGTARERDIEAFYLKYFESIPYFRNRREQMGFFPIPNDPFGRTIPWCAVRGSGNKTVVLLHHNDVVDTDDYGTLRDVATSPDDLARAFASGGMKLDEDAARDLESGDWIFGRGVGDMKSGASIQMALVEKYANTAENADFKGNIVLIGLPDEENLSAGGRGAPLVLKKLKEMFEFEYLYAINSEPTDRTLGPDKPKLYTSSIGKALPLIYARGALSHSGRVYEGLNPINIMAHIVRRLDINPDFIDSSGIVTSAPAAFLYMKDGKNIYDASLPISATGVMNVMFLKKSVSDIIDIIRKNCESAFDETIADAQGSYDEYNRIMGVSRGKLPWRTSVKLYSEIHAEAERDSGDEFRNAMTRLSAELKARTASGEMNQIEASRTVVETTLLHRNDRSPVVVIALAPPYYPVVDNSMLGRRAEWADTILDDVIAFAGEKFSDHHIKHCLVGMSDLSYMLHNPRVNDVDYIKENMLLWGDIYSIPFEELAEISMPIVNIGPWSKGIHTFAERAWTEDIFNRTPRLLEFAINRIIS